MANRMMYFGTRERMTWVKCPAVDVDLSKTRWTASGGFLNGGTYVRSSVTGSKRYRFSWNQSRQEDIYAVLDYADGLYGSGLIYFLEPFSTTTNVLPSWWAAPRLQAEDAPPFTDHARPSLVATPANSNGYPTQSAVFTLIDGAIHDSLYIPIPPGYELHFGVHGTSTDTAAVVLTPEGGTPTNMANLAVTSSTLTNYVVSGDDAPGVTVSVTGEGQLTLSGMVAQVLRAGSPAPTGHFVSGRGHSGCRFVEPPAVNGYSSPGALDLVGASVVLAEVGGWESA